MVRPPVGGGASNKQTMINRVSIQRVQRFRLMNWQRLIYAASMAFYGASIGPLIVTANLLSRTPIFKEPERLPLDSEILLSGSAALAGALLVGLVASPSSWRDFHTVWPVVFRIFSGINKFSRFAKRID